MYFYENPKKIILAKQFRKKPTKSEAILWDCLRNRRFMNLKFRRQFPFLGYVLDFYCCENKICIEVNGGIHYSSKEIIDRDKYRKNALINNGLHVIEVNSSDVENNVNNVCEFIKTEINKSEIVIS